MMVRQLGFTGGRHEEIDRSFVAGEPAMPFFDLIRADGVFYNFSAALTPSTFVDYLALMEPVEDAILPNCGPDTLHLRAQAIA
jgi:hypothetical protein